jgi:hypothetical protein
LLNDQVVSSNPKILNQCQAEKKKQTKVWEKCFNWFKIGLLEFYGSVPLSDVYKEYPILFTQIVKQSEQIVGMNNHIYTSFGANNYN